MVYESIRYEKRDHVGVVTLNRPDSLNTFNRRMESELSELWTDMRNDDEIWVAVVTAAGDRAFCVGVDTKESTAEVDSVSQFERWKKVPGSKLTARQNGCFKPVITAVNGMCAGGGLYFVGDSDIVVAAETATFFDPHVTYGRVAALEPIALTRRMPFGEVMRMALMGNAWRMTAERAHQVGLVQEVVPQAELLGKVMEMAQVLTKLPPLALAGTVEALWASLEMDRQAALDHGLLVVQRNAFTEDYLEGRRAFSDKREPRYKNR